MLDKNRIATMTKLAIMEEHEGMEMMKVIRYRRVDYVLTEIFRGAIAGTVVFLLGLVLWFLYMWDDLNEFIVGLDLLALVWDIVLRYAIFMAAYLVICVIVALRRYKKRMGQRYEYLSDLKALKYYYDYGHRPKDPQKEKDKDSDGSRRSRRRRQEET